MTLQIKMLFTVAFVRKLYRYKSFAQHYNKKILVVKK